MLAWSLARWRILHHSIWLIQLGSRLDSSLLVQKIEHSSTIRNELTGWGKVYCEYLIFSPFRPLLCFNMKLNFIQIFVFLWLPTGFAQTSVPVKQDPLKDSIDKYAQARLWVKVLPFAEQWEAKLKKERKESTADYGSALISLGHALNRTGKSKDAEPLLLQSLEIRKKVLGEKHPDVANSANSLGALYKNLGNYSKAELYYLQALEIRKKELGENHPDVAASLNNIGTLYEYLGNYTEAEPYLIKALEILKKTLGENNQSVAALNNNLGNFYSLIGNYPKAEPFLIKSLEILKKTLGENHPDLAASINNLGNLYQNMGNYPKAMSFMLQALEIWKKSLGENHPNLAGSLNNLGNVYSDMGQYTTAEPYYLQAMEINKKALGENHPDVAVPLSGLGALNCSLGNYQKANYYGVLALEIRKKSLGEMHPEVGISLQMLGISESEMGNYPKAENYYLQVLEIRKKVLGENHPTVQESISNLGTFHFTTGQMEEAEIRFLDWNVKKQSQVQHYFPFLSDNEKKEFYENKLSASQEIFKSFCLNRYNGKKAIAADLYNDQLSTKGLLLNNSAKWKHRIKTSGDKKLFNLYNEWETNQNKLNKLYQSTDSTELAGLDSLQAKTEKMEKELSLRSENFAKLADKKLINWKDVQKALKPGEAAIEMVRVKKFGIEKTVTDTSDPKKPVYKVKGLTDTIYYAALIVKPESIIPEMVVLKNGNDMEGKYLKYYQNLIKNKLEDNKSYHQFWQEIGAKLEGSKRVFFSPDGVYHNINLNTLYNPKTKKYLLEEKDIRIVTVTKDIVNPSPAEEDNKLAELVGFPSYYTNQTAQIAATSERKSPELIYGLSLESTGPLAELPGTKTEVDKIAGILTEKGWEVKNYTGSTALEENIKESYKPRLLHVATHGFFQPDTTKGSNSLLRSGLMLTGAGNTLKGEKNETGEDGILTAYEAMNLNLDNTDLVVLSACETGLGEIKNGEGVYGLQRAFKVAGAKSIIMSLWKVNDEATQELMVSFYKHWLSPPVPKGGANSIPPQVGLGGNTKRAAFLKAQKELKAKYPDPYYWGAFVMVGE